MYLLQPNIIDFIQNNFAILLNKKQKIFLEKASNLKHYKGIVILGPRQSGKTLLIFSLFIWKILNENAFCGVTYSNHDEYICKYNFLTTICLIFDIEKKYIKNNLKFFNLENQNSFRGYSFDYLFIDHGEKFTRYDYERLFTIFFKKIFIFSNSPSGEFLKIYESALKKDGLFYPFKMGWNLC